MPFICAWAASTICSGHPSAAAAAAIFSMTCLLFFSLLSANSLRQVDMASKAAFTASRALFESPGTVIGLKLRGITSTNLLCMVGSPFTDLHAFAHGGRFHIPGTILPMSDVGPATALYRAIKRESRTDNRELDVHSSHVSAGSFRPSQRASSCSS